MYAPWALVTLGIVATVTGARAEERAVVVVDASPDGRGAAVVARLDAALGPDPALRPVAPDLLDALAAPTPVDGTEIANAAAALATARERLTRFEYGEAAATARAAQDALAGEAGDKTGRELLADLAFVEALALAGDGGDATPVWTLVHRLSPGRTLDPARYPPDQIEAFERAATDPVGSGAVIIAAPGASEILVDGQPIGGEPAVAELAPGPHVISAQGDDIVAVGRRVVATAGQTVHVDLIPVLAPAPLRAARARDRVRAAASDPALTAAVASLAAIGGAADAIVVVATDAGLATRLFTKAGGLGPPRPVDDDLGAVLRPLRPLPPARPRVPPDEPRRRVPPGPEAPWHQARWARVSMGVVGAAAVVAVVVAIVARGQGSTGLGTSVEVQ
ncbi:MAG: hypothetical protein R3B06_25450 [Kofleriaceae bacterium]